MPWVAGICQVYRREIFLALYIRYRCKMKWFVSLWLIFEFYGSSKKSVIICTPWFSPSIAPNKFLLELNCFSNERRSHEKLTLGTREKGHHARGTSTAPGMLRHEKATTRVTQPPMLSALCVLRLLVFVYSLCCFVAFLVSCGVNDVEDCKADELHRSLSQCWTTWTVSLPWYVPA